jgi:hypothetical protein
MLFILYVIRESLRITVFWFYFIQQMELPLGQPPVAETERQRCHACSVCSRVFTRAADVVRHTASVHNTQRHVCPVCGRVYNRADKLKRYMMAHQQNPVRQTDKDTCAMFVGACTPAMTIYRNTLKTTMNYQHHWHHQQQHHPGRELLIRMTQIWQINDRNLTPLTV